MLLETALMCMAVNIYHEAGNQSMIGQMAVGQVVLNRVEDSRFPDTVCEVVKQAVTHKKTNKPVRWKCQFTWYCDGKKDVPPEGDTWRNAQMVAYEMYYLYKDANITDGATHYHAFYVKPDWAKKFILKGRIGSHIFYKQK